ncbi:MAG: hypothetical protein ABSA07_05765 [Acidimicrobiales bacterium]
MSRTLGTHLRYALAVAALLASSFAMVTSTAGATSTTEPSAFPVCGIVPNPAVHIVSSGSPCVIRVRVGTNVHIKFRTGFRWGDPVSSSKAVVVTTISRYLIGVDAATLHAAAVGQAFIRTTGTVACRPGVACPQLALLWILKVIVT